MLEIKKKKKKRVVEKVLSTKTAGMDAFKTVLHLRTTINQNSTHEFGYYILGAKSNRDAKTNQFLCELHLHAKSIELQISDLIVAHEVP